MRPFCESAEVACRGYSEGWQRALTDFGAEKAFARAAVRVKEHYGMEVPVSAVREITEEHGAQMLAQEQQKSDWPDRPGVPVLIVEMDGSMLPVVEVAEPRPGEAAPDLRKTRRVSWKEARLALAREPGSVTPVVGATLGSVEEAGERLAVCARQAGAGNQTKFHGVGDAAAWIIEQMEVQFGAQAKYTVDLYPQIPRRFYPLQFLTSRLSTARSICSCFLVKATIRPSLKPLLGSRRYTRYNPSNSLSAS
jgi:hypothetical protein